MSTAMLRVKLFSLEQDLAGLAATNPPIYNAYIEMVHLLNSLSTVDTIWIINLIGVLSYKPWEALTATEQTRFIDQLGQEFVNKFLCNELVTILLQSNSPQLILTSSYLYSVLKMLFVVFGFNNLEPLNTSPTTTLCQTDSNLQTHYNRYLGGRLLRNPTEDGNSDTVSNVSDVSQVTSCASTLEVYETVDPAVYDFIRLFCNIYPSISPPSMGVCKSFPEEYVLSTAIKFLQIMLVSNLLTTISGDIKISHIADT